MLCLVLFAAVHAERFELFELNKDPNVTPIEKVVDLLYNLRSEVRSEGAEERRNYDSFTCFCKDETIDKDTAIKNGKTSKETLESDLESLRATEASLTYDIEKLTADKGQYEAELQKAIDIRTKENAAHLVLHADLTKAVESLESAISSIQGSKSFVETKEVVRQSLAIADAIGEVPKTKVVLALLQGADAPESDYDFHSDGILGTLNDLLTKFRAQKTKAENEEEAARSAFASAETKKRQTISTTEGSITTKDGELSTTKSDIATKSGQLTETNANLNDDTLYLKDLTAQCEAKAREWDQRAKARAGELDALQRAVYKLDGKVERKALNSGSGGRDDTRFDRYSGNKYKFVQESDDAPEDKSDDTDEYTDVVFVQKSEKKIVKDAAKHEVRAKAVTMVMKAAKDLKSAPLSLLAMRMAADPFAKIKTLIQELIERLLKESADEATQKGVCDTALAKANTDRDFRKGDLDDISSDIGSLTAHKVELEEDVATKTKEVRKLEKALSWATRIRAEEKRDAKRVIDAASGGLKALRSAMDILKDFYKDAAKNTVSLAQTDASPVDEAMDAQTRGGTAIHQGAYQGKQTQATGIIGMLETIESDFERTIKERSEAEAAAAAAHTKFDRESKASIASKNTGIARANSDILETAGDLTAAYNLLKQNQDLLDTTMTMLEDLRPQCVDTAMSSAERVARREAEVTALKNAVCVLDEEDNSVSNCNGGQWTGNFLQK